MQAKPDRAHGFSSNREYYLRALRRHAHELINMGYGRLVPSELSGSAETHITGELVQAIHAAMQAPDAPSWVVHYALPKDDPPLNTPGRHGSSRVRVDIEFERVKCGPRPLLRFEAKRLGNGHPVSMYLGDEGLGCFLSGKYPTTHGEGGMLGYIQTESEEHWAAKISAALKEGRRKHTVCKDGQWCSTNIIHGLKHTYRTQHHAPRPGDSLLIHHILLRFC